MLKKKREFRSIPAVEMYVYEGVCVCVCVCFRQST